MKLLGSSHKTKSPVLQSFKVNDYVYQRSYVDCGKKNCTRCRTPDGRRASHGPYWYLCAQHGRRYRRIYIGKNLDTTRFIGSDGKIDWRSIKAGRFKTESASPPEEISPIANVSA